MQPLWDDLNNAMNALATLIQEAAEAMTRNEEEFEKLAEEDYRNLLREPFPKPPRRAPARGLSPVQCRYWVNYKARDKLPRRSRKTPVRKGEEGAHGKERKGSNR